MVDLNNAFGGAATGAGIGASFGPWGALGGGVLGGLAGLSGFGKSKEPKIKQQSLYSPEQMSTFSDLLNQAKAGNQDAIAYFSKLFSDEPGAFEDFERPYLEQFQNEIAPSILEMLNAGQNKYSSGVTNSLANAAKGLSTNLASQRANLRQNAGQMLQNYTQLGLTRQTQPYTKSYQQGAFANLAPAAAQGYQSLLNNYGGGA
jgi:hypothetical protein